MECFNAFLNRLKSRKDTEGVSLFDQSAILFGSGMGNANSHTNKDLPILLAGGGYELGEHRVLPMESNKRVPLCNLFLSFPMMTRNPRTQTPSTPKRILSPRK